MACLEVLLRLSKPKNSLCQIGILVKTNSFASQKRKQKSQIYGWGKLTYIQSRLFIYSGNYIAQRAFSYKGYMKLFILR